MKPSDARRLIHAAGARGEADVEFTVHAAEESMPDDGLTAHDVFHVLEYATDVVRQPSEREKWKVYGPILSGDAFAVVVLIIEDNRVRVLTVHPPP